MSSITNLGEMKSYILRQLGYPVINIELSPEQLDDIIQETLDVMNRYLYGEAVYNDYVVFTTSAGIDEYSLSGNNIVDIYDFEFSTGTNGIHTLFTPMHTLLYQDWVVKGNYPGAGRGLNLTSYQIDMMYLEDVIRSFGRTYVVDWWPQKEILKLLPTPDEALTGILLVWKKSDAINLYNHLFTRQYSIAKAKILWGTILGKYDIELPGGGRTNGEAIKNDGKEELKEVLENIKKESEPVDFIIG